MRARSTSRKYQAIADGLRRTHGRPVTYCLAALCIVGAVAVDGDTLRLYSPRADLRLRVWGIDAPELREAGGRAAKDALAALADGQPLACDLRDVDRYGRPVVRCTLPDGRDVACAMVTAGHAQDWPLYSGGAYAGCEGGKPALRPARNPRR